MKWFKFLTFLFIYLCFSNLSNAQNALNNLGLTSSSPANVAFSVRQLSSSYTGPLFRLLINEKYYDVYPDATNHEISLTSKASAVVNNFADAPASASANSISDVLTSEAVSDAYVAIWYDQSGNQNNLKNSTNSELPKIIETSNVIKDNLSNKPIVYWYQINLRLFLSSNIITNGQVIVVNKFKDDGFLLGGDAIFPGGSDYRWHSSPPHLFASDYCSGLINGSIFQNGNYKSDFSLTSFNESLGINSIAPSDPSNVGSYWDNLGSDRNFAYHNSPNGAGWSEILSFPTKMNDNTRNTVQSSQSTYYSLSIGNDNDPSPNFANSGPINLCINGSYFLDPSTTLGTWASVDPNIATVNSSGYITGLTAGTTDITLTTILGTARATVTVGSSSNLVINDNSAQPNYKFDNNPHGPIGGTINYVGYKGFNYSNETRPTNTGYYRASLQSGSESSCPFEYYIIKCDACSGTVSQYSTRPQGSISGNTISIGSTGQLTYTSNNGGGPFTIVYQKAGSSPVTVNHVASGIAFNVTSGTPTITTTYKLINVTDETSSSSADFSGATTEITVNPQTYSIGDSYGGGTVFSISGGGTHGLIVANQMLTTTVDHGGGVYTCNWADAKVIAPQYTGGNHNDWRLPSLAELGLINTNLRGRSNLDGWFWSSDGDTDPTLAYIHKIFSSPADSKTWNVNNSADVGVIAIRAF